MEPILVRADTCAVMFLRLTLLLLLLLVPSTHLECLTGCHQFTVDINLPKLILDDSNPFAMLPSQDVVQQRCFATSQKASDDLWQVAVQVHNSLGAMQQSNHSKHLG